MPRQADDATDTLAASGIPEANDSIAAGIVDQCESPRRITIWQRTCCGSSAACDAGKDRDHDCSGEPMSFLRSHVMSLARSRAHLR